MAHPDLLPLGPPRGRAPKAGATRGAAVPFDLSPRSPPNQSATDRRTCGPAGRAGCLHLDGSSASHGPSSVASRVGPGASRPRRSPPRASVLGGSVAAVGPHREGRGRRPRGSGPRRGRAQAQAPGAAELLRAGHGIGERETLQVLEDRGVGPRDLPDSLGDVEVIDLVMGGVGEPVRERLAVLIQPVVHAQHLPRPVQADPVEPAGGKPPAERVGVCGRA